MCSVCVSNILHPPLRVGYAAANWKASGIVRGQAGCHIDQRCGTGTVTGRP